MSKVLIVSTSADPHAAAVAWGLQQLGVPHVLWDWSRFPGEEEAGLWISPVGETVLRFTAGGVMHEGPFDVIWWRRPGKPTAPAAAHADDRPVIEHESEWFLNTILPFAAHAATRWVNEPLADKAADNKARQLVAARQLGFRIPDTLMGNGPGAARAFLRRHGATLAHKGFRAMLWENEDGSITTGRTALVGGAQLARDFAVRACPSIYQNVVPKQYELRVTVMGDQLLAARIDSQRDGPTVDWRVEGGRGRSNLSAASLPADVAVRCERLCRQLGLAFGCIDLVVTPDDEVWFLEVNPAGQFLFAEMADPSIRMLDTFCRYLGGVAPGAGDPLSLQGYHDSPDGRAAAEQIQRERAAALGKRRERAAAGAKA
jgi:hypothetical protein